jgi:hypothetical protein
MRSVNDSLRNRGRRVITSLWNYRARVRLHKSRLPRFLPRTPTRPFSFTQSPSNFSPFRFICNFFFFFRRLFSFSFPARNTRANVTTNLFHCEIRFLLFLSHFEFTTRTRGCVRLRKSRPLHVYDVRKTIVWSRTDHAPRSITPFGFNSKCRGFDNRINHNILKPYKYRDVFSHFTLRKRTLLATTSALGIFPIVSLFSGTVKKMFLL